MKKVFMNSADVIHMFAQRTQSEGRCSNVFFEYNRIYSYGRHYLLGEFIELNGRTIIHINDKGYSNTTAKHIGQIKYATTQYEQVFKTNSDLDFVHSFIMDNYNRLGTARKPEKYIGPIIQKYEAYVSNPFFNPNDSKKLNDIIEAYNSVSTPENVIKAKDALKRLAAIKKKEAEKELKEALQKFDSFEINDFRIGEEDYLRLSFCKQFVETSQGVKVYIEDAKNLYRAIKAKVDIKGMTIKGVFSSYRVASINGVLTIGCHRINMKSVKKVGEQITN